MPDPGELHQIVDQCPHVPDSGADAGKVTPSLSHPTFAAYSSASIWLKPLIVAERSAKVVANGRGERLQVAVGDLEPLVKPEDRLLRPLALRDVVHRRHRPGLLPAGVIQWLPAGQYGPRGSMFRGNHHFDIVETFASQCAKQRNVFGPHPRFPIRQVEVVVLRPLFGGNGLLRKAVKLSCRAIEQREDTIGIAGHDARFNTVEHGFEKPLLPVQRLLGPLALGDVAAYPHESDDLSFAVFEGHFRRQDGSRSAARIEVGFILVDQGLPRLQHPLLVVTILCRPFCRVEVVIRSSPRDRSASLRP